MSEVVRFFEEDEGVTAIEYALIAGTTALVLVAILPVIQSSLSATFAAVSAAM